MDDLLVADPTGGGAAFPDHWTVTAEGGEHELPVSYVFDPGARGRGDRGDRTGRAQPLDEAPTSAGRSRGCDRS